MFHWNLGAGEMIVVVGKFVFCLEMKELAPWFVDQALGDRG